jgi:tRNA acetyltransferase TAN1
MSASDPAVQRSCMNTIMMRTLADPQPSVLTAPGICVTAVQNKEKSAERELMEALESVADELYPETADDRESAAGDEGEDLEKMLEKELHGMSSKGKEKSKRFRRFLAAGYS